MLDVRCLEFSNGVLAASALFHFSSLELVESVSGKLESRGDKFVVRLNVPSRGFSSCVSFRRRSSEEGGGGAVREVDGALRNDTARSWQLGDEVVCGDLGRRHAQHPDSRLLYDLAGKAQI